MSLDALLEHHAPRTHWPRLPPSPPSPRSPHLLRSPETVGSSSPCRLRPRPLPLGRAASRRLRQRVARRDLWWLDRPAQADHPQRAFARSHGGPRWRPLGDAGRPVRRGWRARGWRRLDTVAALAQRSLPLCSAGHPRRQPPDSADEVRRRGDAAHHPGLPLHLLVPRPHHHEARVGPARRDAQRVRR